MWFCIPTHRMMPLTRIELRTRRPQSTIEHGQWNTRLVAELGRVNTN